MLPSACDGQPRGVEMMVQPVVSRSQRRIERKQLVLVIVLILAVAGVSFSLGVLFGQRSASAPVLVMDADTQIPAKVAQVAPPPPPQEEAVPEKPEKLTFYDNLPKGNQAPLGSGINLPPEEKPIRPVEVKPKRSVKETPRPAAIATEQADLPAATAGGAFIIQVASFRTGEDAKKLAGRLKGYKISAFVEKADLGDKGVWHRVMAGPYSRRESADEVAAVLKKKERLSALVRQR